MRKKLTILFSVVIVLAVFVFLSSRWKIFPFGSILPSPSVANQSTACLGDDEVASYQINKNSEGGGIVTIEIKKKTADAIIKSFTMGTIDPQRVDPLEIHHCHIYVSREFNVDYKRNVLLPGFSEELWAYDFNGIGNKIITFVSKDFAGKENGIYDFSFKVNDSEQYLVLTRGYLGSSDYAVVVKDLKTLNDIFVLTSADLMSKYKLPQAEIGAGRWLDNNTFLVFVTDGAVTFDEIVVSKSGADWKLTILPVPDDASVVTAWNPDGYWIAYNDGPGWIGAEDVAQGIYQQWRAQGKEQSLFAYNLATKQKVTLATTNDPSWSFKTIWVSTTTLQYTLPSRATSTYVISQ